MMNLPPQEQQPVTPQQQEDRRALDAWLHSASVHRRSSLDDLTSDDAFGIDEATALRDGFGSALFSSALFSSIVSLGKWNRGPQGQKTSKGGANAEWGAFPPPQTATAGQQGHGSSQVEARMCTPCVAPTALANPTAFPPLPFAVSRPPVPRAAIRRQSSLDYLGKDEGGFGIDEEAALRSFEGLAAALDGRNGAAPRHAAAGSREKMLTGHDLDALWGKYRPQAKGQAQVSPVTSRIAQEAGATVRRASKEDACTIIRRVSEAATAAAATPVLHRVELRATLARVSREDVAGTSTPMSSAPTIAAPAKLRAAPSFSRSQQPPAKRCKRDAPWAPATPIAAPVAAPASAPPALHDLDRFLAAMERSQKSQGCNMRYREIVALMRETNETRGRLLQWVCGEVAKQSNPRPTAGPCAATGVSREWRGGKGEGTAHEERLRAELRRIAVEQMARMAGR